MPNLLLMTEQERLRQLFARMGKAGLFSLRVAPTLGQGEEEISLRLPHYIFVENHLSGLTGAAITSHLRGLIPEQVEVVLMARDTSDAAEIREAGGLFSLDLSLDDAALQRSIADIVPRGAPQPLSPRFEPAPSAAKTAKELLFSTSDNQGPITKHKGALWRIPLALAAIVLGVTAYHPGKAAPPAPQNAASIRPLSGGTEAAPRPPQAPASQTTRGIQDAGKVPVLPDRKGAATDVRRYSVRPGDSPLKILVKDFSFSCQDATKVLPEFKRLNNLSDLRGLKAGQSIVIPALPPQQF